MDDLRERLLQRFKQAGPVVPFERKAPHPKVPTLLINGRKYALSDYWPMSTEIEEMANPEGGGAKLITGPGNRFRYLWLYDTERQILAMWRGSDGNEKRHDRVRDSAHDIYTLEKKGQLNRVTHEEFVLVEREMTHRADETYKSLKQWAAENQSDLEKQAGEILDIWFNRNVKPTLDRRLADLTKGVKPLGFKVNPTILEHRDADRQARQWLVTKALEGFHQAEAYDVVSKAVGYDAYNPPGDADPQAVQWAYNAFIERTLEKYDLG